MAESLADNMRRTRRSTTHVSSAGGYGQGTMSRNSGGGGGSRLNQLRKAQRKANKANKKRYKDILSGIDSSREETTELLEGVGAQAREDIGLETERQLAEAHQNMVGRGLSGTTIGMGNANMINALAQGNINRLNESLAMEKLGMLNQLESERRGVMERRNDVGPDLSLLARLESFGRRKKRSGGAKTFANGAVYR